MNEQYGLSIEAACELFGHSARAYYYWRTHAKMTLSREKIIVEMARAIREQDPGIGSYKMWLMIRESYDPDWMPGRDAFFRLMKQHSLSLPPPRPRRTTNSNHRYHKYRNLIKDIVLIRPNQLWVSDITYIDIAYDRGYLHLITDAYSHKILGWCLSRTLYAENTLSALRMAIEQTHFNDLSGLIHHSDRGVQYCCNSYVEELKKYNISISMTEDYKPTDNAIAERVNGILKQEWLYRRKQFENFEEAHASISQCITFYNDSRPHMSVGYQTPTMVHLQEGIQQKCWKGYYERHPEKMQNVLKNPTEKKQETYDSI
jgi:transposase InsO family protein